jgi:hypothetical protein
MEITIDLPEKVSTNKYYSGMHWTKRNKLKDMYLFEVKSKIREIQKIDNPVNIEFYFFFKSRALDSSNCSIMGKMIEDSLVKIGILNDDTYKHVRKVSYTSNKGEKDYVDIIIKKV